MRCEMFILATERESPIAKSATICGHRSLIFTTDYVQPTQSI